jgi:hypothetical protein
MCPDGKICAYYKELQLVGVEGTTSECLQHMRSMKHPCVFRKGCPSVRIPVHCAFMHHAKMRPHVMNWEHSVLHKISYAQKGEKATEEARERGWIAGYLYNIGERSMWKGSPFIVSTVPEVC